jgi:hypothetical protein
MSNALAISAVTATLQYYLTYMYATAVGLPQPVKVSCVAPDQALSALSGPSDAENQVNLFLHQVTHNAAWRNAEFASFSGDGTRWLTNPPLALNLHYLLTAYGTSDWQAEALLGYALMLLHECPVLSRGDVAAVLAELTKSPGHPGPFPNNTISPYLSGTGLADQIEMIKITPEPLGREEMAWLWTALKADYRLTYPFQVAVLLMQPQNPASLALPALRAAFTAQPMVVAQIDSLKYLNQQTAALPGDTVTVMGSNLTGASQVMVSNQRYGVQLPLKTSPAPGGGLNFTLPLETAQVYPAGVYDLAVEFLDPTGTYSMQTSNTLPLAIAPTLPSQSITPAAVSGTNLISVTVTGIAPVVYEGQSVWLALSTQTAPLVSKNAPAQSFTGQVTVLTFQFDAGLPAGTVPPTNLLGRLVVDGVTSQVQVNWAPFPPTFAGPWVVLL